MIQQEDQSQHLHSKPTNQWLPWTVLLSGLFLTTLATFFLYQNALERQQNFFKELVRDAEETIHVRINSHINLLRGGAGLFAANTNVTPEQFRLYVNRLKLSEFYAGVQGVGFSIRVASNEVAQLETQLQQQGMSNFTVWPKDPRSEYHSIIFIEPRNSRNVRALGYDMFSEPIRRSAMEQARDLGVPTTTEIVRLVQETDDNPQPGFLMYVPVYTTGSIPGTVQERRATLRGFIYSPFRVHDLFGKIFESREQTGVAYEIYPDQGDVPVFTLNNEAGSTAYRKQQVTVLISLGNRTWRLVAFPNTRQWSAGGSPILYLVPFFGTSISLLLFIMTGREARARQRSEQNARELFEQREWLQVTLSSIGDAVIAADTRGLVTFMNPVAEKITEWTRQEAVGKSLPDIFPVFNQETGLPIKNPVFTVLKEHKTVGLANHTILYSRTGAAHFIDDSAAPIRDKNGVVIGVILVFHEVTEQRQYERRAATQHAVTRVLAEALTFEQALPQLLQAICENLSLPFGAYWLCSPHHKRAQCHTIWTAPGSDLEHFRQGTLRFSPEKGEGLPGMIWESGKPEWSVDLQNDHRFIRRSEAKQDKLHSAFGFPIATNEKFFGVFEFMIKGSSQPDEALLNMGASLGSQIGDFLRRKQVEVSLKESEELHRTITETAADAILTMDEESRILSANKSFQRILGYTPEELIGQDITILMPARFHVAHRMGIRRFVETGQKRLPWDGLELPGLHKNGTEVPLEVAFGMSEKEGRRIFTGFLRDISQRKKAEERLLEQARTLELLNQVGSALSAELDLEKLIQAVTDAATKVSGARFGAFFYNVIDSWGESYTLYAISGVPREAFSKFPTPRNTPLFSPTFKGEGIIRLADVRKDPRYGQNAPHRGMPGGHLQVVSYLAVPVVARSGEVLGGLFFGHEKEGVFTEQSEKLVGGIAAQAAIAIDNARLYQAAQRELRERTAIAENLRETEERFRLLVDRAEEYAIFMLDSEGRISSWNLGAERIFGYSSEEVLGRSADIFFDPKDQEANIPAMELQTARERRQVISEHWQIRKNGTRFWASGSLITLDQTQKQGFAKILRDMTHRKNTEEQIRKLNTDLEERVERRTAALQESKEQMEAFTYTVAHDLRAPLRAMQGFSHALIEDCGEMLSREARDYLDRIRSSAERMDALIQDLLSYSQVTRSQLRFQRVDLRQLIEQVQGTLAPEIEQRSARFSIEGEFPPVVAHAGTLESVLQNLVSNAIKFTPPEKQPIITITGRIKSDCLHVAIKDEGIGIAPEHHERVFRIFERLHAQEIYPGTGMGLALVKKSLERMNGSIGVESELGRGSTFWFRIPLAPAN
ncbi:MAG: PAS domain S-box protein [Verrucomicrobiota bacterium]|nr:PAS domain S-box protein [Verrucomicrobiota bacterium]